MNKIWDFIRKLFGLPKPTKSSQGSQPPKPVRYVREGGGAGITKSSKVSQPPKPAGTEQPTAGEETPTKGGGEVVQPISPSTPSGASTSKTGPKDKDSDKIPEKPPQIDGRRKQNGVSPKPRPPKPKANFVPRPELICREKARVFDVILSVPSRYTSQRVEQNGAPLHSKPDNEYIITDLSKPITLKANELTEKFPLFSEEKYMIFKTRNSWEGTGHYVKNLTRGYFAVITPSHWHREGPAMVEPILCSDEKYLVHFFETDPSDEPDNISFFKECQIPPIRQKIFLKGKTVQDDSKQGKLFVEKPPNIKMKSDSEIAWIRIGKEGRKKTKSWSCDFKLAERNLDDVLKDRYGHFFLRAYNKDIQLIDSTEFRYYGDLSKIQIDGESYNPNQPLPPPHNGYKATHLEFMGKKDNLLLEGRIDPSKKGNTIWTLKSESGKVRVAINLPRIRWQLSPIDDDRWSDKPILMTREKFRCLAHSGIKLQLYVPRYIKKITMGFNEDLNQTILTKEGISLTSFVDYEEIDLPQSNPSYLQFTWNDIMVTTITIQADKLQIKPATETNPSPNICNPKLRPTVTGNRGLSRQGKGFSRGELELANINTTRNVYNIYYIDHRRRTVHQENVDILKGIY